MGPDFLGNSCSNTLRSNCSQLKWPLMRQQQKNNWSVLLFRHVWTSYTDTQKLHLMTLKNTVPRNAFLHESLHCFLGKKNPAQSTFKPPHFSFSVTMSSLLFCHSPLPPSFLSFLCPPPTARKTAETACHPGNPAWSPEQLSNISLNLPPPSVSISQSLSLLPSQTASLTTERSELSRLLSPGTRNKSTHHRISPGGRRLKQSWYCFTGLTLATVCVTAM